MNVVLKKERPLAKRMHKGTIFLSYKLSKVVFSVDYPPKLSKRIMSSSTPSECRRSSTVFAIIGGPQR